MTGEYRERVILNEVKDLREAIGFLPLRSGASFEAALERSLGRKDVICRRSPELRFSKNV